jgi:hypothetical protein
MYTLPKTGHVLMYSGGLKEMSSILADHAIALNTGGGGVFGVSAN